MPGEEWMQDVTGSVQWTYDAVDTLIKEEGV